MRAKRALFGSTYSSEPGVLEAFKTVCDSAAVYHGRCKNVVGAALPDIGQLHDVGVGVGNHRAAVRRCCRNTGVPGGGGNFATTHAHGCLDNNFANTQSRVQAYNYVGNRKAMHWGIGGLGDCGDACAYAVPSSASSIVT